MKLTELIKGSNVKLRAYSQATLEIYGETIDEYPRAASAIHFIAGVIVALVALWT